jgi:hypothetical protein
MPPTPGTRLPPTGFGRNFSGAIHFIGAKIQNPAACINPFGENRIVQPPHRQHRPLPPPPLRIRGLATFLKKKSTLSLEKAWMKEVINLTFC